MEEIALSVQHCFEEAAKVEGVTAVAVCDDLELVGQPGPVFEAYDRVEAAQRAEGINRVSDKRFVLWIHNYPPPETLQAECITRGLTLHAGEEQADGSWKGGCKVVLGCLFSANQDQITDWLEEKVLAHTKFFDALVHPELQAQT